MAKKRGESGSNLGLIITLVFFVLSTVILGVTTYIGYSGQDELVKAKEKAEREGKQFDMDAKHYRFAYRIARSYMDQAPGGVDPADLAREKQQFDQNQFQPSQNQKDKDEIAKWLQGLNAQYPWQGNRPAQTLTDRINELSRLLTAAQGEIAKRDTALARAKQDAEDEKQRLEKQIQARDMALNQIKTQLADERAKDKAEVQRSLAGIQVNANTLAKLRQDLEAASKSMEKMSKEMAKEKKDRQKATDERNQFKRLLDEANQKLEAVVQRTGVDLREIEAKELTASAKEKLDRWNRDWQIVAIDRQGTMPYINIGSADKVRPQLTFSVHDRKADGRLNPTPKATLEVVKVIGAHLSQARITSSADKFRDPVLKGDRLFHPTWDPDRKKYVAIAGVVDLEGDGTDATKEFRRLLEKQNIEVDSYIDLSDEKAPKLWERQKGRPVSIDTEYLILGYNLNSTRHPKARDAEYTRQYDQLMKDLRKAAADSAVKVIRLGDYLEMMGYNSKSRSSLGVSNGLGGYGR